MTLHHLVWLLGIFISIISADRNLAPIDCLSEADFWNLVSKTDQVLQTQTDVPEAGTFDEIASQWRRLNFVCLDNGERISVEGGYIARALDTPENLQARLSISPMVKALEATRKIQLPDPDPAVQQHLKEILSRPEFQWPAPRANPLADWVLSIFNRLFAWMDRLLAGRNLDGNWVRILQSCLLIIGTLLFGALIYFIVNSLRRSFTPDTNINSILQPGDEYLDASAAQLRAEDFASIGDWRSALRYKYLFCLLTLDEAGILRFEKSRTNHEYLAGLNSAGSQPMFVLFSRLVEIFENSWYGFQPIDSSSYSAYAGQANDLQQLAKDFRPGQRKETAGS